jgi:phage terminase large subunit-like protein
MSRGVVVARLPECDSASIERFCHPQLPVCTQRGDHFCAPRAIRAVSFFDTALVHVKGVHARRPFVLADFQRNDIIGPMFGAVAWNEDYQRYTRQYRSTWIELGRKNGKSALLAGVALYLLAFDGEEGAEIYGLARDRDQARIIWDVASRMVQLSPALAKRKGLVIRNNERRIVDHQSGSYYAILPRDALGNLGFDPYGVIVDEVIAQPDGQLWDAMRTAMGSRPEAMILGATTAGNDPQSFAAMEHAECARIAEEPERAKHRLVYIRNTPTTADPWNEANWYHANPALGSYLNIQALRDEAQEAQNDPTKENAFRQYRLNQWVSQSVRWMPMHIYRGCTGELWPTADWAPATFLGQNVWVGLDLSAKHDLTSMCIFLPPKGDQPGQARWVHWIPESAFGQYDTATSRQASQWAKAGFLRIMEGSVIDYQRLCADIELVLKPMKVQEICYDKWSGEYVRQELERRLGRRVPLVPNEPTFVGMTVPMRELMALTTAGLWQHHGDPVAMHCFDAVEVKRAIDNPDLLKPTKPERLGANARIDAVIAAALAVGAWRLRGQRKPRTGYGFAG